MKTETAKIKSKKADAEVEFSYSFPETLAEATATDGEERVLKLYLQERKTSFLDYGRALLESGKSAAEVAEAMSTYKLGDRRPAAPRTPVHVDVERIKQMSDEERTAAIALLMSKVKELKGQS